MEKAIKGKYKKRNSDETFFHFNHPVPGSGNIRDF
jgi:hypothetical protein